jgi:hypothetical protein
LNLTGVPAPARILSPPPQATNEYLAARAFQPIGNRAVRGRPVSLTIVTSVYALHPSSLLLRPPPFLGPKFRVWKISSPGPAAFPDLTRRTCMSWLYRGSPPPQCIFRCNCQVLANHFLISSRQFIEYSPCSIRLRLWFLSPRLASLASTLFYSRAAWSILNRLLNNSAVSTPSDLSPQPLPRSLSSTSNFKRSRVSLSRPEI